MKSSKFSSIRFADGDDEYSESSYVILGMPLEATTVYRKGTRFGPSEIRKASHCFESYDRRNEIDLKNIKIHDYGNIGSEDKPKEIIDFSSKIIEDIEKEAKKPILLGGEHTISIAGFTGTKADSFIVLDAHLDLKESYKGKKYNHASVSNLAVEKGLKTAIVGARSGSSKEWKKVNNKNIEVFKVEDLIEREDKVIDILKSYENPYLSLDLDVLDPGIVSGVGTPEPFGLYPRKVRNLIESIAPKSKGFDIVELSPKNGSGSFLAAKLVRQFISSVERK